jgi:hypothetical protein
MRSVQVQVQIQVKLDTYRPASRDGYQYKRSDLPIIAAIKGIE